MAKSKLAWNYDYGIVVTLDNITVRIPLGKKVCIAIAGYQWGLGTGQADEPLLSVPASLLFSRKQLEQGPLGGCQESSKGMKAMTCLKLYLLYEKFNSSSFYAPYMLSLIHI